MIVPEADWVFLVLREKRTFQIKEKHKVGVISIETFHELLRDYIKTFEWPALQVGIIRPESSEKVGKILQSVEHLLRQCRVGSYSQGCLRGYSIP